VISTVAAGRGWSIVPDQCVAGPVARQVTVLRHPRRRVRNAIYALARANAPEHPTATRILALLRRAAA
jgi:DNA-binding transcriptional LysR family regulator